MTDFMVDALDGIRAIAKVPCVDDGISRGPCGSFQKDGLFDKGHAKGRGNAEVIQWSADIYLHGHIGLVILVGDLDLKCVVICIKQTCRDFTLLN